ncbi:phytochrome A-associated F-box protein [Magnolia sinica]|uniref:phytochrome A-associated F-box protein n=1 Tax=Magnolia sinica TaxID=86752 RepID=UPI0026585C5B|nr:phytochrome A-associated F-box protein [Magnolia sinica]
MAETAFSRLSDDVVLNIFLKLEDDPRNWARLACVCTKFSSLVRNVCWKNKCSETIPSVVSDLLAAGGCGPYTPAADPPGGWAALHKLSICCPGLLHAGILLENSDFGLEREIGPDENYRRIETRTPPLPSSSGPPASLQSALVSAIQSSDSGWSLFDDLYFDTVYDDSESHTAAAVGTTAADEIERAVIEVGHEISVTNKRRKLCQAVESHLASGAWNLSREQGNKLLASRFRGDCLYICDWPGCVHMEEKRNYMLFRGVFKNFKRSRVWRTINDTNRNKITLDCAFCSCKETWDLHSAFCLRRVFGYHDDGEPVVRAYVCENGHVSGAWTDRPMYT